MLCQSNEELQKLVDEAREYAKKGKVADYIPALAKNNPDELSVAIQYPDGRCISAGDIHEKITLQSISKIISLALVLIDHGEDAVFRKVGMEPTGDPFNSIAKLETMSEVKPLNPMINAGALAVTHLIKGNTTEDRFNRLLAFSKMISGNSNIGYSEEVAESEMQTSHLNRSLCYFLKQHNIIDEDVEELMSLYTKQCAIEMTCFDLAKAGLVFALDGKDPETKEQIIPVDVSRICKTFMVTCGMYNEAGEFAIKIGIPAKSGVSGGILGAVPGKYGIGISGPSLNEKGNSIAGLKLLELLSKKYSLSIF
ncbi:glutaminase A [Peribacillus saganii]|uniref:Glutaminase n=1 Tax=Peribacillus saganii TaxID=2303992 RepID=A0A372LK35_9BACI|nr:glutaminase A [Peribacillus saganii]RFU66386.1 glutaminase A [Peribacillus saganii]